MTTPDPSDERGYGRPQGPRGYGPPGYGAPGYGAPGYGGAAATGWGGQLQPSGYGPVAGYQPPFGPVGRVRGTGITILLFVVTFGIYGLFWYYTVHDEMKRHTGTGLGGPLALLIAFFAGIVSPFITSSEVGGLYERAGRPAPVSGTTGLWSFPGIFLIVGPLVWFVKTNGALNDYWRSLGATG